MTPLITVVIPTHNRAKTIRRTLDSLDRQTTSPDRFEVVVVMDSCTDETADLLANYRCGYGLSIRETAQAKGPAAARNLGASCARGRVLLFLDDDMEAKPGLIEAHLAAHSDRVERVVLGYFPMQPPEPDDDLFTKASRLWWADGFAARGERGYRFTFKDLCTGNFSLPTALFTAAGGFDERYQGDGAGEDYEFGYRLIELGARFVFVKEAASIHHTRTPLAVRLRRARQEGTGHALLVRRHPELYWEFNISRLSRLSDMPAFRPLWRALWAHPSLAGGPAWLLERALRVLLHMRLHSLVWRLYVPLYGYEYWRGVRSIMNLAEWERLGQDAPVEMPGGNEVDLELPADFERFEQLLGNARVDSVRVWYRGVAAGRIPACAGAEPLTAEHIRVLLVRRFGAVLVGALVEETARRREAVAAPAAHPGMGR